MKSLPERSDGATLFKGCLVCNLPNDGAVAVLCDSCLETNAPILDACHGELASGGRAPRESLTEAFDHDMRFHEDEQ